MSFMQAFGGSSSSWPSSGRAVDGGGSNSPTRHMSFVPSLRKASVAQPTGAGCPAEHSDRAATPQDHRATSGITQQRSAELSERIRAASHLHSDASPSVSPRQHALTPPDMHSGSPTSAQKCDSLQPQMQLVPGLPQSTNWGHGTIKGAGQPLGEGRRSTLWCAPTISESTIHDWLRSAYGALANLIEQQHLLPLSCCCHGYVMQPQLPSEQWFVCNVCRKHRGKIQAQSSEEHHFQAARTGYSSTGTHMLAHVDS
jgi:hypothetical protein